MKQLINSINRLMLVSCGTNLIVGFLCHESYVWYSEHESYCWNSVARILLAIQPASQQQAASSQQPAASQHMFDLGISAQQHKDPHGISICECH